MRVGSCFGMTEMTMGGLGQKEKGLGVREHEGDKWGVRGKSHEEVGG